MKEKIITESMLLNMIQGLENTNTQQVKIPGLRPSWVISCTIDSARKIIDAMEKGNVDWPLLIRITR